MDLESTRLDFNIVVPAETPPSFACQYGGQAYTLQVVAKDDDGATFKSSKRELTLINITPSFDQNDYLANLSGNHVSNTKLADWWSTQDCS